MRLIILGLTLLLAVGGCYNKPVRHLASDASLIKAGESTRKDVLQYLGEPDGHRNVGPGVEEFMYHEDKRTLIQRQPLVGSMLNAEGYETLIITLTGDLVTGSEFRTFKKGEMERFEGFSWDYVDLILFLHGIKAANGWFRSNLFRGASRTKQPFSRCGRSPGIFL